MARGDQISMFEGEEYAGEPPFEKGSDTSRDAAVAIKETATNLRGRIFHYVRGCGAVDPCSWIPQGGATDDEIEAALGLRHQTASARRRELVLKGLLKDSGRSRATSSGRRATVWVAVDP